MTARRVRTRRGLPIVPPSQMKRAARKPPSRLRSTIQRCGVAADQGPPVQPDKASSTPLPSRGFLLTRLSDADPAPSPSAPARGRHPKPSYEGPEVNHFVGLDELRFVRQGELPANLVSGRIL